MNIDVIISNKNFTIIRDNFTNTYHCYSYCKPIANYDNRNKRFYVNHSLVNSVLNKHHVKEFREIVNRLCNNLFNQY